MSGQQNWDEDYKKYVKEIASLKGTPAEYTGRREKERQQEAVGKLERARNLITEALVLIREATDEDAYVETYLGAVLSCIVGEDKYMSHNLNIQKVIRDLEAQ